MTDDFEPDIPCPPGVPPQLWHCALDVADAAIAEVFNRDNESENRE
jgi:hypothetical protein